MFFCFCFFHLFCFFLLFFLRSFVFADSLHACRAFFSSGGLRRMRNGVYNSCTEHPGGCMKKLCLRSEAVYVAAVLLLSFSVAMTAAADFGVSMVVAPAYILSLKTGLTFGQCEYLTQALLFIVFCLLMGRLRPVYFFAFFSAVFYGAVLDVWRFLIPAFNPAVTAPGSQPLVVRILLLAVGMSLSSLAIALFFRTYLYPQVNDFFVKGVSWRFSLNRTKFKTCFDAAFLLIACAMTLLFFGRFRGIGVGTVVMTCVNGPLIGLFGKLLDARFRFVPWLPKLEAAFALEQKNAASAEEGTVKP